MEEGARREEAGGAGREKRRRSSSAFSFMLEAEGDDFSPKRQRGSVCRNGDDASTFPTSAPASGGGTDLLGVSPSASSSAAPAAHASSSSLSPREERESEEKGGCDEGFLTRRVVGKEEHEEEGLLLLGSCLSDVNQDFSGFTFETDAALIESLLAPSTAGADGEGGDPLPSSAAQDAVASFDVAAASFPSLGGQEDASSASSPPSPASARLSVLGQQGACSPSGLPAPSPLSSFPPPSGAASSVSLSAESLLALAPAHASQIKETQGGESVLSLKKQDILAAAPPLFSPPTVPEVQNVVASGRVAWKTLQEEDGACAWTTDNEEVKLDLRHLAISCRFAEYNPRKINACIIRLRNPKCTVLVFRSGRLMITGARSEAEAERAARLVARMLTFAYCGGTEKGAESLLRASPLPSLPSCKEVGGEEASAAAGPCAAVALPSPEASMGRAEKESRKQRRRRKLCLRDFKVENVVASADCGVPVRLEGLAFEHKEFSSYEPELFSGLVYRYNPTASLKAVLLVFVSGKVVITGCKNLSEVNHVFEALYPVLIRYHQ
ncbi:TATA-box binding protein TBP2 [Besnoitia besnoiti]|uniref:TATA-box binding protein TBP2 n=1 Tax=Besnoitia besnoiti TaxID=94643 RepID=A0A2A9M440_BESBE|nr:TATA-box binding protein TBP2 [Besnoitia besnoiti]PFH33258.1 TATA-box binding protein TBP2 [Besnoitia besnoiti]